jgi:hypothetical protein
MSRMLLRGILDATRAIIPIRANQTLVPDTNNMLTKGNRQHGHLCGKTGSVALTDHVATVTDRGMDLSTSRAQIGEHEALGLQVDVIMDERQLMTRVVTVLVLSQTSETEIVVGTVSTSQQGCLFELCETGKLE